MRYFGFRPLEAFIAEEIFFLCQLSSEIMQNPFYDQSENPYQQFLHSFLQEFYKKSALTKIILQYNNSFKVARQPLVCDYPAGLQCSLK